MRNGGRRAVCAALISLAPCTAPHAHADNGAFISLYTGQYSQTALNKVVRFDIYAEWTFAPPGGDNWEGFLRARHRSSAYGVLGGIDTASNYAGLGVRYRF